MQWLSERFGNGLHEHIYCSMEWMDGKTDPTLTFSSNFRVHSELELLKPKPVCSRNRLKTPSKQRS